MIETRYHSTHHFSNYNHMVGSVAIYRLMKTGRTRDITSIIQSNQIGWSILPLISEYAHDSLGLSDP